MLFIYIEVDKDDDDYSIHSHISTLVSDSRCAIYHHDKNKRLYVFIHSHDVIDELDRYRVIPIEHAANAKFAYKLRIPTGSWNTFTYPYICDATVIYDIEKLYNIFSQPLDDTKAIVTTNNNLSMNTVINEISIIPTYDTISKLIYCIIGSNIVCTCPLKKTFYVFSNIWIHDESYSYIYKFIMYDFMKYIEHINSSRIAIIDESRVLELINNRRDEVIIRLAYMCENKHFMIMLDSKTDIICVNNGVYDFRTRSIRQSSPEDYLSIYIPHNLLFNVDTTELMGILSTIFPDSDVLDFFLDTMSLAMAGRNYEKIVVVWLGRTDSGKSTCQEFLEYVLGEYCGSLPSSMFVGKRNNPNGTTSAISSIGSKRLLFLQEPEDSRINSSQLKLMSSNDKVYMRELYQRATSNRVKAITVIVTNGRIDLSACDEASLSRIVVIPFTNTFHTSRMIHRNSSQKADANIINKLMQHSEAMLSILVDRFSRYMERGYIIPEVIKMHTISFIRDSNPILYFMNECITCSPGSTISVSNIYSAFSMWYRESYPSSKVTSLHYFKETISSSGYTIDNGNILNCSIR